jgi:hypothetical protein
MLRIFPVVGLCFGLLAASAQAAPKKRSDPIALSAKDRASGGEYAVQILLPQSQIESSYDLGRVARPPSGGLIDTLIVYSLDDKKKVLSKSLNEKAEQAIMPLRRSLEGFDVGSIVLNSTEKALALPNWFRIAQVTLNRNTVPIGPAADQTALVAYHYEMSPDFSHLIVIADLSLIRNAPSKNGKSMGNGSTVLKQTITSIAQLHERSFEPSENVQMWSADQGKLAKNALVETFAQMEHLIPLALNLTQADMKAFAHKNREQGFAAGHNGPLIKRGGRSPDDVLIWADGLFHVHTLP